MTYKEDRVQVEPLFLSVDSSTREHAWVVGEQAALKYFDQIIKAQKADGFRTVVVLQVTSARATEFVRADSRPQQVSMFEVEMIARLKWL